jgi:hypothetical protein
MGLVIQLRFDFTTHDIGKQISLVWKQVIRASSNQIESGKENLSQEINSTWDCNFQQHSDSWFSAALHST